MARRNALSLILESELEKAEIVLAVKGLAGTIQKMAEDLAKLQSEEVVAVSDRIKAEFGIEAAKHFSDAVSGQIQQAFDTIRTVRDAVDSESLVLSGDQPAQDMGANMDAATAEPQLTAPEGGDMGMPAGDEMPAEEPAPDQQFGREVKAESVKIAVTTRSGRTGFKLFESKTVAKKWINENRQKLVKVKIVEGKKSADKEDDNSWRSAIKKAGGKKVSSANGVETWSISLKKGSKKTVKEDTADTSGTSALVRNKKVASTKADFKSPVGGTGHKATKKGYDTADTKGTSALVRNKKVASTADDYRKDVKEGTADTCGTSALMRNVKVASTKSDFGKQQANSKSPSYSNSYNTKDTKGNSALMRNVKVASTKADFKNRVTEAKDDTESLKAKAKKISDKIDAIVKDGGKVGLNDPLSKQLRDVRAKIQQSKKKS